MDCFVNDCDDDATGELTVDKGDEKVQRPACPNHEGQTLTSCAAHERSRSSRLDRMTHQDNSGHGLDREFNRIDGVTHQ